MFVVIPRVAVLKQQRKREQDRRARCRYEERNPGSNRHKGRKEKMRVTRDKQEFGRPFLFWDGEGPAICHPFLGTEECLELLMQSAEANPDAINVAFGFNYDVSMILRELPR